MNRWQRVLIISGICSLAGAAPAWASTNLETSSPLAGIAVVLNNYYAGTENPEHELAATFSAMDSNETVSVGAAPDAGTSGPADTKVQSGAPAQAAAQTAAGETAAKETKAAQTTTFSAYSNVAVSKVNGSVNIRTEANTASGVTGKIANNCAATILDTVDGEDGKWYKIQSGSVTGYIKAEYFVTGEQAEKKAKQVGKTYGTVVDTSTLRLRENSDLTSKTLTLLSEGTQYTVLEEQGDFLKVSVDTDLEGYVFKDYMKTTVEFDQALSVDEEKAKAEEESKRKEEADKAIKQLEEAKKAETAAETKPVAESTAKATEAATKAPETTKSAQVSVQTIAANPEKAADATVAAPTAAATTAAATTAAQKSETISKGPGSETKADSGSSSQVSSATRTAIVAYAKQFLGNPYVYGGTSLTNGADCSGYVMSIFSHFGISTGRSSRDQAAKGKVISVSEVQPGDLLFYASGNYINHVGIYIGGGQIIHSSTPATGICYAPSNYRTPCKAVTFLK